MKKKKNKIQTFKVCITNIRAHERIAGSEARMDRFVLESGIHEFTIHSVHDSIEHLSAHEAYQSCMYKQCTSVLPDNQLQIIRLHSSSSQTDERKSQNNTTFVCSLLAPKLVVDCPALTLLNGDH